MLHTVPSLLPLGQLSIAPFYKINASHFISLTAPLFFPPVAYNASLSLN